MRRPRPRATWQPLSPLPPLQPLLPPPLLPHPESPLELPPLQPLSLPPLLPQPLSDEDESPLHESLDEDESPPQLELLESPPHESLLPLRLQPSANSCAVLQPSSMTSPVDGPGGSGRSVPVPGSVGVTGVPGSTGVVVPPEVHPPAPSDVASWNAGSEPSFASSTE